MTNATDLEIVEAEIVRLLTNAFLDASQRPHADPAIRAACDRLPELFAKIEAMDRDRYYQFAVLNTDHLIRTGNGDCLRDAIASRYTDLVPTKEWGVEDAQLWRRSCDFDLAHPQLSIASPCAVQFYLGYSKLACAEPGAMQTLEECLRNPNYTSVVASVLAQEHLLGRFIPYNAERAADLFSLSVTAAGRNDGKDTIIYLPIEEPTYAETREFPPEHTWWENVDLLKRMVVLLRHEDVDRFLDSVPLGNPQQGQAKRLVREQMHAHWALFSTSVNVDADEALMEATCKNLLTRLNALLTGGAEPGANLLELIDLHTALTEIEDGRLSLDWFDWTELLPNARA
ncbi:TPA: hypothetical protein QDB07_001617 [Burkholderia vietnamiensis]|uniref:hypothetical protein n=1 Tax=Burkholderia vietnamiensis TaxID=60552 RepID=UPI00330B4D02|nr:hypothetical protein [Burkholderia vietnamiensis]